MTSLQTKLDMYASPQSEPLFAALGEYVLDGVMPSGSTLILGQICGIEYAHSAAGQFQYLASFSLPAFAPGYYNSVLVSRAGSAITGAQDLDLSHHRIAINEIGSFSGAIAPAAHLLGHGQALFEEPLMTGGHLNSLQAVAEGDADFAAIDRVTFNLARQAIPDAWQRIMIFDETAPQPGLPFICDAAIDGDTAALLRQRLCAAPHQDFWADLARLLGVVGIDVINEDAFALMRHV